MKAIKSKKLKKNKPDSLVRYYDDEDVLTPLAKANELIERYLNTCIKFIFTEHSIPTLYNSKPVYESAVDLSLIKVDEILQLYVPNCFESDYWHEVKKELLILKLKKQI